MSYNTSLTTFSADGHLFQVEYAGEAVKKGLCAVGVRGTDCVVLAVEKKSVQELQDRRTIRKIYKLDEHAFAAFAGMSADARVLVQKVQLECQSFRLNYEDAMDVDFIVRHLADLLQKATQSGGRRPYGVACIVGGFNVDGTPQLWMTEPSGLATAWKACAIGNHNKTVNDSLENGYSSNLNRDAAVRLAVRSLLEVVESGARNIELTVITRKSKTAGAASAAAASATSASQYAPTYDIVAEVAGDEEIGTLVAALEKERAAEREKKRKAQADE